MFLEFHVVDFRYEYVRHPVRHEGAGVRVVGPGESRPYVGDHIVEGLPADERQAAGEVRAAESDERHQHGDLVPLNAPPSWV